MTKLQFSLSTFVSDGEDKCEDEGVRTWAQRVPHSANCNELKTILYKDEMIL
jgi:hypothetical protein